MRIKGTDSQIIYHFKQKLDCALWDKSHFTVKIGLISFVTFENVTDKCYNVRLQPKGYNLIDCKFSAKKLQICNLGNKN